MIFKFFRRNSPETSIARLYGTIVAQARAASFYRIYGVPDTVNGRFEMVVLHLVLVLRRLEAEPPLGRELGQSLFDWFCSDMDGNLREMGVGDLAVPRRMRKIGEAFFDRQAAYTAALSACDAQSLAAALARNVFDAPEEAALGAPRLAAYMRLAVRVIARRPWSAFRRR